MTNHYARTPRNPRPDSTRTDEARARAVAYRAARADKRAQRPLNVERLAVELNGGAR